MPPRYDAVRVVALTACAGATDPISYLGLGHVFPANMTGNTVLLGLGVATRDYTGASRSIVALGAFVVAAFVVGFATAANASARHLRAGLAAELTLIATAAAWWLSLSGPPRGGTRYALIALVGAAMGTQSAVARALNLPGVTTTYLTGTWTALASTFGHRARTRGADAESDAMVQQSARITVVATYVITALLASATYVAWHAYAILIPFVALAIAVGVHWRRPPDTSDEPATAADH